MIDTAGWSLWGGGCDGGGLAVDRVGDGAAGFDYADGRVGVVGWGSGDDCAAGDRKTHFLPSLFLFVFRRRGLRWTEDVVVEASLVL